MLYDNANVGIDVIVNLTDEVIISLVGVVIVVDNVKPWKWRCHELLNKASLGTCCQCRVHRCIWSDVVVIVVHVMLLWDIDVCYVECDVLLRCMTFAYDCKI
ncbi:hypothetical protein RND81_11G065200 [Saponaria officinalis]|uniref:Uncharacterized protein n=1 Tax=Saponaria officinalis TaxID=3572 RepID=A0AAW1HIM7_SAPOF